MSLQLLLNSQTVSFILTSEGLRITRKHKQQPERILSACLPSNRSASESDFYPARLIISAKAKDRTLQVYAFASTKSHDLSVIQASLPQESKLDASAIETFAKDIQNLAYQGAIAPPSERHVLVLVNPLSGQGKGPKIVRQIEPWFKAAGIKVTTLVTKRAHHATEIVSKMSLDEYDTVATVSGDGLIYEVIEGFANREKDGFKALKKINIGVIPSGSGNAVSVSLRGPVESRNMVLSFLAIIKGKKLPVALAVVTIGERKLYSFLSQAYGLISDLDIETENLRWIGESRFIFGFVRGALQKRHYDGILEMKLAPNGSNKRAMLEKFLKEGPEWDGQDPNPIDENDEETWKFPPLKFGTIKDPLPSEVTKKPPITTWTPMVTQSGEDNGGWLTVDLAMLSFLAGKTPYISYNFMPFPIVNPADPYIDIHIIPKRDSALEILSYLDGSEAHGASFYKDTPQFYYKAEMYRFTPKPVAKYNNGNISPIAIDGEYAEPYEPFQVECLPATIHFLGLDGWYNPPDHKDRLSTLK